MRISAQRSGLVAAFSVLSLGMGQLPPQPQSAQVEKIGDNLYRLGQVRVDVTKKEVTVPGVINPVKVLEFVANTQQGFKAYESAITAETNAVTFNAALLLIGLDRAHAKAPRQHFDSSTPEGDQVEIWVEWDDSSRHRIRAEQLVFDQATQQTIPEGPWVYTGSTFLQTVGGQNVYLAESDGVLIGFVHSPAPVIENTRGAGLGRYGSIVLNPNLALTPGQAVRLIIKGVAPVANRER